MSETHFSRLVALVEKIKRLSNTENQYSGIGEARFQPSRMIGAAKGIKIAARDDFGNRADQAELDAATEIQNEFVERYRIKGEEAKRARLVEIANELESLRIELPHVAAKACIEIGVLARECRAEADA